MTNLLQDYRNLHLKKKKRQKWKGPDWFLQLSFFFPPKQSCLRRLHFLLPGLMILYLFWKQILNSHNHFNHLLVFMRNKVQWGGDNAYHYNILSWIGE